MRKPEVRIVQNQQEEITGERTMSEKEAKEFLYKHHPEIYKQMYPDIVTPKEKEEVKSQPKPHQKREGKDIQKSDNVYTYNKYGDAKLNDYDSFNYNIEIKTDMKFNK